MKGAPRTGLSAVAVSCCLLLALLVAAPASAETVPSLGPLELFEGAGASIVSPSLLSFGQVVAPPTGTGFGRATGAAARTKVSEIKITKPIDVATPRLFSAASSGKHFKKASIELFEAGSPVSVCLEDAFLASDRVSGAASGGSSTEEVQIAYVNEKLIYGGGGCEGAGGRVPDAIVVLTGLGPGGATIGARVDCLAKRCRGSLAVELPGGGTSGAGKFWMGDGSVRTLTLAVPSDSRAFLRAHPGAKLKTLLTLGGGSPLIGHDALAPVPRKIEGLPSLSVAPGAPPSGGPIPTPTPTPTPTPAPLAQSLTIDGCAMTVVGTPTLIAVSGSLSPARGGVALALEYVPTSGPAPFPAPVTDTTDAAGHFGESFDRRREGLDYSWTVTASTGEGGGYLAARSAACAIPIP